MRFQIYFLLPVPLAGLGQFAASVVASGLPSVSDAPLLVFATLVAGYVAMGLQSLLFAWGMLWLERRQFSRRAWLVSAATAGGVAGATLILLAESALLIQCVPLGVSVGFATALLADVVDPLDGKPSKRVRSQLALLLVLPCGGATVGATAYEVWLDWARRRVLASVTVGMSYDDVSRVAGMPDSDSREQRLNVPSGADVSWIYLRRDPVPRTTLEFWVLFKDERVITIDRLPVSRD